MGRPPKKLVPEVKKLKLDEIFQASRGTKDILPNEQPVWQKVYHVADHLFDSYGFRRIDVPMFEDTALYERGVGGETDVVQKEMYTFKDRSGRSITLRPEATAGIVRAYIENGMSHLSRPLKLFTTGPMFRYERPQAGRMRQFHQLNAEVIGEQDAVIDAQVIQLGWNIIRELGINNVSVHINSIGCRVCRGDFKEKLVEYYESKKAKLCIDCKRRLQTNPMRIMDCKEEKCQRLSVGAPQMIDNLCPDCHAHFKLVLEYLDELQLGYTLNPRLVRGLDYYTKTVFEFVPNTPDAAQSSLGGGGRYDDLVELLGGKKPTPACGFALGVERLVMMMLEQNPEVGTSERNYDIFIVQLGDLARKKSLQVFEQLRASGLKIAESFSKGSVKSQLKRADRLKVDLTLILGQKEAIDSTVLFRDMESGVQEVVSFENVVKEAKKRLTAKRQRSDLK